MKLWTLTNDYAEVIVNGELIKVDLEYIGTKQAITIDNKTYFVNKLN
jgi:hypothetical protein